MGERVLKRKVVVERGAASRKAGDQVRGVGAPTGRRQAGHEDRRWIPSTLVKQCPL